jgi:8-oxo-dGTP pyrophosphatase MutT (NUDIX family)
MNRLDLAWIRQRLARHEARRIDEKVAPRRAAVACILQEGADDPEMLFIRRATQQQDPWSGHMAFPGGQVEPDDATPLDTARRETLEEVEIDLARSAELLGQLDEIIASAGGRVIPMAIAPFVFQLTEPAALHANPSEVEEALWVPTAMLLDPAAASTVPYELGGQRFDLPCFRVWDRVIWGLTYQMLMRMFAVLDWEVRR